MNLLFLLRPHEDYRPLLELVRRLDNEAAGARPTSKPAASHEKEPHGQSTG